jgi:hypothetical protein
MCKCWQCGAEQHIGKPNNTWTAKVQAFTMRGTEASTLQPVQAARATIQPGAFVQTPIAQQNIESAVKVPLAQSLVTAGFIGSLASCAALYFSFPKPGIIALASTLGSAFWTWKGGMSFARDLVLCIEDFTQVDINRDNHIGQAPEPINTIVHEPPPILYNDKNGTRTIPGIATPIIHKVVVRKATLKSKALEVDLNALCQFIRQAVAANEWSREYWAGKTVGGVYISQSVWSDYRRYFLRGDIGLWELGAQPPPALNKILANFRLTATNQPKPTNQLEKNDVSQ